MLIPQFSFILLYYSNEFVIVIALGISVPLIIFDDSPEPTINFSLHHSINGHILYYYSNNLKHSSNFFKLSTKTPIHPIIILTHSICASIHFPSLLF